MEVILRERNEGMNEINDPSILQEERIFGFGSEGPSMVQSCMMEKTSKDREHRAPYYPNFRIIPETVESAEGLSNRIVKEIKKAHVDGALTAHPFPFRTSPVKDLSNWSSRC